MSFKTFQKRVALFQKAAEQTAENDLEMQLQVTCEELQELTDALWWNYDEFTDEDRAKEMADVLYTLAGLLNFLGWDMDAIFNRVCDSNESKLWDGKLVKNSIGKVVKGPNYKPPYLSDLVGNLG